MRLWPKIENWADEENYTVASEHFGTSRVLTKRSGGCVGKSAFLLGPVVGERKGEKLQIQQKLFCCSRDVVARQRRRRRRTVQGGQKDRLGKVGRVPLFRACSKCGLAAQFRAL